MHEKRCQTCSFAIEWRAVPAYFTQSVNAQRYREFGCFYDNLYDREERVWSKLAGRGQPFVRFVARQITRGHLGRYLDIGCGEGFQLEAVAADEKHGVEISEKAALKAAARAKAKVCLASAEELPYLDEHFDALTSIGVLTHLFDGAAALREARRVLRPGGSLVLGVVVQNTAWQGFRSRVAQLIFVPSTRQGFARRALRKFRDRFTVSSQGQTARADQQPLERRFSAGEMDELIKSAGFAVDEAITTWTHPVAPLIGPHFRVYILRRHL